MRTIWPSSSIWSNVGHFYELKNQNDFVINWNKNAANDERNLNCSLFIEFFNLKKDSFY